MLSHRENMAVVASRLYPRLRVALPGDRAAPCSLVSGSRARPGRGCPSGGAPGAPVWWSVLVFRAPAQLGPWWVVGSVGAFPGGPAGRGRWRAYPAVVRAGVWPLPLSVVWAVSLVSALVLVRRPAR